MRNKAQGRKGKHDPQTEHITSLSGEDLRQVCLHSALSLKSTTQEIKLTELASIYQANASLTGARKLTLSVIHVVHRIPVDFPRKVNGNEAKN